jgi:hypothetical protein
MGVFQYLIINVVFLAISSPTLLICELMLIQTSLLEIRALPHLQGTKSILQEMQDKNGLEF